MSALSSLFQPGMPWWEFVLRAVVVYAVLLVLVRLSGKRSVGQFTPFDMVLLILLGNAVQSSLIGRDVSLAGGLILATTLIVLNYVVAWFAARYGFFDRVVEGRAVRFVTDGEVDRAAMQGEGVTYEDLHEAMRRNGVEEISDVRGAWIEKDGEITIVPRRP